MENLLPWVLFWLFLCNVPACIATYKGRSGWGFFVFSILLTPLIGLLLILVLQPTQEKLEQRQLISGETRKCPSCAEVIKGEAKICRFCGRDMPVVTEVPLRQLVRQ